MLKFFSSLGIPWEKIGGAIMLLLTLGLIHRGVRKDAANDRETQLNLKDHERAEDTDDRIADVRNNPERVHRDYEGRGYRD